MHNENTEIWNRKWENVRSDSRIIKRHFRSGRWKKIDKRVKIHFGSFRGLKVIELGSGRGTESLLMALQGASVTLVDNSNMALTRAKELFKLYNLNPACYNQDIFDLDDRFLSSFDISMSFGVVEHFLNRSERDRAIRAHYDVLKPRGIFFISVPNKRCPHYRLALYLGKVVSKHNKGVLHTEEKPFTYGELKTVGEFLGLKHIEVFGSSFFDFSYNPLLRFINLGNVGLKFFDDYLAYAIVFSGTK